MNAQEFITFRHKAVHILKELNEKCSQGFGISSWPRYDYDLDQRTLTFSKAGIPKVICTIQVVGTTSKKANNWLWGRANAHFPMKAVEKVLEVRRFGEEENVPQLSEPYWPDDEYHGWEMAAISAQVLSSRGAYRCPASDGFIYFVFSDITSVTSDRKAMAGQASDTKGVKCDDHGVGRETFVCEHLAIDPGQEWFSEIPSESNPWPDAWCTQCNQVFNEQGEWNEKNEDRLRAKLLCHLCYEIARNKRKQE